ncbi:hypothetical protein DSO57_1024205 [Entomophthora muscae]|uniref:Uncharacterized protein n=1 Tax=Entomophthora muscae TaxID=34485 RepID=A0ACC2T3L4_9FUNG|nr:hypothetical protein DSO57_1024205 [Entomophthora muscae]
MNSNIAILLTRSHTRPNDVSAAEQESDHDRRRHGFENTRHPTYCKGRPGFEHNRYFDSQHYRESHSIHPRNGSRNGAEYSRNAYNNSHEYTVQKPSYIVDTPNSYVKKDQEPDPIKYMDAASKEPKVNKSYKDDTK